MRFLRRVKAVTRRDRIRKPVISNGTNSRVYKEKASWRGHLPRKTVKLLQQAKRDSKRGKSGIRQYNANETIQCEKHFIPGISWNEATAIARNKKERFLCIDKI